MKHTLSLLSLLCLLPSAMVAQAPSAARPNALPFDRGVRIDVVAAKPARVGGGDYDDKTQNIALRLKFTNIDTRQGYDACTAKVSLLGQSTIDRNVRVVMLQEDVPLASLAPRQVVEHTTKTVSTRFDKTGAIFGFMYDGWVIVVKDATGKIVQVKSTAPTIEKVPDQADKLAAGTFFGKNFEPVDNPDGRRTSTIKIMETETTK